MDLRFTGDELAFRDEVRSFIRENVPQDVTGAMKQGREVTKDMLVRWTRILDQKGWSTPHWPQKYGGTGWDPVRQYIFQDEIQQAPAPQMLAFGHSMVGPVIYTFGNDEQKKHYLPRIAHLDDWWCQGFSEPGAGSDLASLKTKAFRDGDHYVVDGQKTWTTLGQHADWIFCLVRTDPDAPKRQMGISFLLVDMTTPGVEVRPIQTVDGGREVNEVFFTDVKVPVENRVGEENKGWDYAKFLLGNERVGIARIGASKERIRRLKEIARLEKAGEIPVWENRRFREKVAAVEIELKALEMTQLRVVCADARRGEDGDQRGKPDPASSILKIKGSELQQATTELLMEAIGPYALPYEPSDEEGRPEGKNEPPVGPDYAAPLAPGYFNYRKVSIYGGSNEIQKNIIAKAILGL